ncbi:MAG: prepilin peptidase [Bacteroidota bacterium]
MVLELNSSLYMTLGSIVVGLSAALLDIKYRKIPNWLTFPAMLTGVILNLIFNFKSWHLSLLGLLVGLLILLIPFILGGIGAGDVKLLMALGAFLGVKKIISVGLCSGVAGGVLALLALTLQDGPVKVRHRLVLLVSSIWDKDIRRVIFRPDQTSKLVIPYGPAILIGLIVGLVWGPLWE